MLSKLNTFLESIHQLYTENQINSDINKSLIDLFLEKLYGEWNPLLSELMNIIDDEFEKERPDEKSVLFMKLVNDILTMAETLLNDEKYKSVISYTPLMVQKVLGLLESLDGKETKKIALRLLRALGQNKENKTEIGKLEGFRKMMSLMINEENVELKAELARTFRHLADVSQDNKINQQSSISGLFGEKITKVVNDVKDLVSSEMTKFFASKEDTPVFTRSISNLGSSKYRYVPSKSDVNELLEEYANPSMKDETPAETTDSYTDADHMFKEFMRMQGALVSLTSVLKDALMDTVGRLNIFETICRLLFQNQSNQKEFRNIDGYAIFMKLFDDLVFDSLIEKEEFIMDCFNIFFVICLDGNNNQIIGNLDAFLLLFKMSVYSKQWNVKRHALLCIQDLLSVNPKNTAAVIHVDGINILFTEIRNCFQMEEIPESYSAALCGLLNYIAVLMCEYDSGILSKFFDVLDLGSSGPFLLVYLKSVNDLVKDYKMRCVYPETGVLETLIGKISIDSNYNDANSEHDVPLTSIDVSFEFGKSNDSLSLKVPCRSEIVVSFLDIVSILIEECDSETFDALCGFETLCTLFRSFPGSLDILNRCFYIVFTLYSHDDDVSYLGKWTNIILKIALNNGGEASIIQSLSFLLFLSRASQSSILVNLCDFGLLNYIIEYMRFNPRLKKRILQSFIVLIGRCEASKEFLETRVGLESFRSACLDEPGVVERICWLTVFEACVDHNLASRFPYEDCDSSEWNYAELRDNYLPKLLYQSTLSLSQPRKCHFEDTETICSDYCKVNQTVLNGQSGSSTSLPVIRKHSRKASHDVSNLARVETDLELVKKELIFNSRARRHSLGSCTTVEETFISTTSVSSMESRNAKGIVQAGKFRELTFRNSQCAAIIIKTCERLKGVALREFCLLLHDLCLANPVNSQMLFEHSAQEFFLTLLYLTSDRETFDVISRLIRTLGSFSVEQSFLELFFELLIDPKSANRHYSNSFTFQVDMQAHLLRILLYVSSWTRPCCYFHFTGVDGSYVESSCADKLATAKNGFTLLFWMKPLFITDEEMGIMKFRESQGSVVVMELYFRLMDRKRCICARSIHGSLPPEDYVFDRHDFVNDLWVFVAISYSRSGMTLYVNGSCVQRCSSFTYPFTKDKPVKVVIGTKRPTDPSAAFYGQIGPISFLDGQFEDLVIEKIFRDGPWVKKASEQKELLSLNPTKNSLEIPESYFRLSLSGRDESKQVIKLGSKCYTMETRMVKDVVESKGLEFILRPLWHENAHPQLINVLMILLQQSPTLYESFVNDHKGFMILLHLPKRLLIKETLEAALDLCCVSLLAECKSIYYHPAPLLFTLDLLLTDSLESVKGFLVRTLFMKPLPENVIFWKKNIGLAMLFEIIHSVPLHLPLTLLDRWMSVMEADELDQVLAYLSYDRKTQQSIKGEISSLLLKHLEKESVLIDHLRSLGGYAALFPLLEVNDPALRFCCLKIFKLLLKEPNSRLTRIAVNKVYGFDVIGLYLSSFPETLQVVEVLLETATLGSKTEIHYPEMFKLVFDMISNSSNREFVSLSLNYLCQNLFSEPEILRLLWDANWLEWISLHSTCILETSKRLWNKVIMKLIMFDISRKNSVTLRVKGALVDDDTWMVILVELVIEYLLLHPVLKEDVAEDVLRNVALMYRYVENIPTPPTLRLSFASCVNNLAYRNTPQIRTLLTSTGFFSLRDDIISSILQEELVADDLFKILTQFSFDMIADQVKFRESDGLLCFLFLIHKHSSDPKLLWCLCVVLVTSFLPIEDNRRIISKLIDNSEVTNRLFSISNVDSIRSMLTKSDWKMETRMNSASYSAIEDSENDHTLMGFLLWYFNSHPDAVLRRNLIEQKIQTLFLPIASQFSKQQEKWIAKKNRRAKARKDRLLRNHLILNKSLVDYKAKAKVKLGRCASVHQDNLDAVRKQRFERFKLGEEAYRKLIGAEEEK